MLFSAIWILQKTCRYVFFRKPGHFAENINLRFFPHFSILYIEASMLLDPVSEGAF